MRAELAGLAARGAAVLLVAGDGLRVLWCTPSGASLFGARSPEDLERAPLDPRIVPVGRLAALAAGEAPTAGARLERLRLNVGRRSEMVTLACRRVQLDDGSPALLAIGFGARPVVDRTGAAVRPPPAVREATPDGAPAVPGIEQPGQAGSASPLSLADLRTRMGGRSVVRFVWQTDAAGRFVAASPDIETLVGTFAAPRSGDGWDDLIARGLGDPGGALQAALAARSTFTGIEVAWPVGGADFRIPVLMSGVPDLDAARQFGGFRGFGLCRLDRALPAPPPLPDFAQRLDAGPEDDAGESDAAAVDAIPEEAVRDFAAAPEPGEAEPAGGERGAEESRTVVDLGKVRSDARAAGAKVVHLHGTPSAEAPALTRSERHAFREIARALGARLEGQDEEDGEEQPAEGAVEPSAESGEHAPAPTSVPPAAEVAPAPQPPGLEAFLDRLPIGILVIRGEVPILMNRALLDMVGYADVDAFHDDGGIQRLFRGRAPHVPEGAQPPAEGTTVSIETREGDAVPVEARLQTIAWEGLPATLISFRRAPEPDLGPRLNSVELELQSREAEARELRAMLDTATDGVVTLDESGRILAINRSGEALFGYDQREVAGEPFISLLAPDSHATALDYLQGLRSDGVASILNDGREVVGRVRQGGRIPLFMTLGAISTAPNRKFCAVLRDLTPWKKAEGELVEARRAAEEASAQKSDFLAKISHEIRTPLSAIIGFAEVMIEERFGPIGNERYLEYLRDIHSSGGHVISLVNDLLDLSKIEAGRFDLTFTSVDLNEIVSRSVAIMQPQAGTGRVVVRSALAARLPRVVADERSLRQIVLNLLSNAIKFTDPGGQVIVSTALTDQGEVVVRIRDTGIGMSEKDIETALEPFRQVSTTRRAGGTGLGLPLTKALVEANRAALSIRSARDAGTLVEVTFPTTRVLAE